jgi:hypothetical protein
VPSDLLGNLVGGGMVGTVLVALIGYIGTRRKAGSDVNVATFATLKEMNALLIKQLKEVQAELDAERKARRALEDRVAILERRSERS